MWTALSLLVCTLVSVVGWKSFAWSSMPRLRPIRTLPVPQHIDAGMTDNLQQVQRHKLALDLLDCLTSPKDTSDPQYSFDKDTRREALMAANDYSALKSALRRKGLRTSGDKLEMITRLLLHEIDPSIRYDELAGPAPRLAYIDEEDIRSERVRVRTDEERAGDSEFNIDPDADDMALLKHRPDMAPAQRMVMDGLDRKETAIEPVGVRRSEEQVRREDFMAVSPGSAALERRLNDAYIVMPQQTLPSAPGGPVAVVLLPGGKWDWRSKGLRVLADELCFAGGTIVIVPDLDRQRMSGEYCSSSSGGRVNSTVFDDIVAAVNWVRTEYGARAVTLAGVSDGAGLAMEAACDLHDIGRLAQYAELEDGHYRAVSSVDGGVETGKTLEDAMNGLLVQEGEQIGDQADCGGDGHLLISLEKVCEADKEVFLRVGAEVEEGAAQLTESAGEGEGEGEDGGEPDGGDLDDLRQVFEEMEIDADGRTEDTAAAHDEARASAGEEETEGGGVTSARSIGDLLQQHSRAQAQEARQRKLRRLREEWLAITRSAARARDRQLVRPYPSLALKELKRCVPRAVLALEPRRFDVDRVGSELQCALFVVASGHDPAEKQQLRALHGNLSARKDEIVDYCIQVYDAAAVGFAVDPSTDHDRRCAQQAIGMGSLWLEAFSGRVEDGLLGGIGTNKNGENAFMLVDPAEMVEPIRPPATATHFHDQ